MRRIFTLGVVLGLLVAAVATAPVSAGTRQDVTMTVTTIFGPDPSAFTATGLTDCSSGGVTDGGAHVQFARPLGVFAGFKVFDCNSGAGFVVRLNALFGSNGSTGTWAVVDAWGSLAGLTGEGKLTGYPISGGILDMYTGTLTY